MLDTELAELYRVPTFRLNETVKRNLNRFPDDFMFQLSPALAEEIDEMKRLPEPPKRRIGFKTNP
jgi:hypothetical protein